MAAARRKKPRVTAKNLPPSQVESISVDHFNTAWRADDREAMMEIVFARLDLAAIALAGPGVHAAHLVPKMAVRMPLKLARDLAMTLLSHFQLMKPEHVERHGVKLSEIPVVVRK